LEGVPEEGHFELLFEDLLITQIKRVTYHGDMPTSASRSSTPWKARTRAEKGRTDLKLASNPRALHAFSRTYVQYIPTLTILRAVVSAS
jgi:hypothetical protein